MSDNNLTTKVYACFIYFGDSLEMICSTKENAKEWLDAYFKEYPEYKEGGKDEYMQHSAFIQEYELDKLDGEDIIYE